MTTQQLIKRRYPSSDDRALFQQKLLRYFDDKKHVVFLNSNNSETNFLAVSDNSDNTASGWKFGFISYDYKNEIEDLSSNNFDGFQFPNQHFFSPEILFSLSTDAFEIHFKDDLWTEEEIDQLLEELASIDLVHHDLNKVIVTPRVEKEEYLRTVNQLINHIQKGDIYEVNYCQEFYAQETIIDPISLYFRLNELSPTPFSCFVKYQDQYLVSASPERFIQKKGSRIISEPIKGTIKRGVTKAEDDRLVEQLRSDKKELSENIMIVDLVRNDLSKIANRDAVKVEELCEIYTFPQVHQMISTVSAEVDDGTSFDTIIKALFPMGSMTGAPKVSAMKLIERYEATKRGLYSGTVGCITPEGNFDFNVVIRSLLYNKENSYLSFMVGGAITAKSDPEKEYEECLLKAKALMEVLSANG